MRNMITQIKDCKYIKQEVFDMTNEQIIEKMKNNMKIC